MRADIGSLTFVLLATLFPPGAVPAARPAPTLPRDGVPRHDDRGARPGSPVKELILPGESFLVAGRPAFILTPPENKRSNPQPWVFYAPTLPPYPDQHEKWMHEQFLASGVAVAGIDVGEAYGSPRGRELFTALYRELIDRRGF